MEKVLSDTLTRGTAVAPMRSPKPWPERTWRGSQWYVHYTMHRGARTDVSFESLLTETVIYSSGSPYAPVKLNGELMSPSEDNNIWYAFRTTRSVFSLAHQYNV